MRPLRRLLSVLEPAVYAGNTAAVGTAPAQSQLTVGTAPAAAGIKAGVTFTTAAARGVAGTAGATAGVAAAAAAAVEGTQAQQLLELGPVTAEDLVAALSVTKSSAQCYEKQYAEFSSKFGQAG
jgi:hypothetical protein